MNEEKKHSVCRMCHTGCDLLVTVRDGKVTSIGGDKNNPAYHGFTCPKGRETGTVHHLPSRLMVSQKRQADGSYQPVSGDQATAEIAAKLKQIIAEHGPNAVAYYQGTFGALASNSWAMGKAVMKSMGSPMYFTAFSIDQPAKVIAPAYHGRWLAGIYPNTEWDAALLVGANPIVSMGGMMGVHPSLYLKNCLQRGMKLVVIDPRRTETAKKATIHLQCKPREDSTILAGIVRQLLQEDLIDNEFVADEAEGLEVLRAAVEPFTPEYVAARAGVKAADLIAAARLLGAAKKGFVSAGTGPNMAGHGNLLEYLSRVLFTLRGWWVRAGTEKYNPGVFIEPLPAIAASPGPEPVNFGNRIRTRGLGETPAGMPTAALPDEILTPGKGQIKALIVVGGNPMMAFPDQIKTHEAMKALDLLVCIDPRMSETSRLADYVLAPKLSLEVEGNTAVIEIQGAAIPGMDYHLPYGQVTPAVLETPAGSELLEEWEWLYDIAQRMGIEPVVTPISILDPTRGATLATKLDMQQRPSTQDFWRMVLKGSPVSYDEVRTSPEGKVYPRTVIVQPKPADWKGRLQLGSAPMMEELAEVLAEQDAELELSKEYPFRMLSMRLRATMNSCWHENPRQQVKQRTYNPVYMHPDDLDEMGITSGDIVEIRSPRATIQGVAEGYPEVRRGCVSMSHGWGSNPDEPDDPIALGGNTGRLIANDIDFDRITGIPRMSAVPVRITPVVPAR